LTAEPLAGFTVLAAALFYDEGEETNVFSWYFAGDATGALASGVLWVGYTPIPLGGASLEYISDYDMTILTIYGVSGIPPPGTQINVGFVT
jgi:hypothetical protein